MITNKTKLTITDGKALVAEFNKSGLKPGTFCTQRNIPYHIFQYWRGRCKELKAAKAAKAAKVAKVAKVATEAKFLPINLVQSTSKSAAIKINVNEKIIVEVANEVDYLQLKKILEICVACG